MGFQKVRVCLEELSDQSLEGDAVYIRVWVEKFEIYLDTALLNNNQRMVSSNDNKESNRLCVATPFVVVIVALSSLWHCSKIDGHVCHLVSLVREVRAVHGYPDIGYPGGGTTVTTFRASASERIGMLETQPGRDDDSMTCDTVTYYV
jgi:hypothetical protein